ncbi:MAG TPA: hypothetical protein VM095_19275 [Pyrinomonadaceae bacterium]|nr:hypothetical protein [Pyrinomonadaceae bacterium]
MPTEMSKDFLDANDPPIIITGGGVSSASSAAKNTIDINFDEDAPTRVPKHFKAKHNADPFIKGVTIEVEGKDGVTIRTATLDFPFPMQYYKVKVTFATSRPVTPIKPTKGAAKRSGGKKRK